MANDVYADWYEFKNSPQWDNYSTVQKTAALTAYEAAKKQDRLDTFKAIDPADYHPHEIRKFSEQLPKEIDEYGYWKELESEVITGEIRQDQAEDLLEHYRINGYKAKQQAEKKLGIQSFLSEGKKTILNMSVGSIYHAVFKDDPQAARAYARRLEQSSPTDPTDPVANWFGQVGGSAIPTAAALGASVFGPGASKAGSLALVGYFGTASYGSAKTTTEARRLLEGEAISEMDEVLRGVGHATAEAAAEYLNLKFLRFLGKKDAIKLGKATLDQNKNFVGKEMRKMIASGMAEGAAQESATQLAQNWLDTLFYDPEAKITEGVGMAALAGAVGAGPFAGLQAASQKSVLENEIKVLQQRDVLQEQRVADMKQAVLDSTPDADKARVEEQLKKVQWFNLREFTETRIGEEADRANRDKRGTAAEQAKRTMELARVLQETLNIELVVVDNLDLIGATDPNAAEPDGARGLTMKTIDDVVYMDSKRLSQLEEVAGHEVFHSIDNSYTSGRYTGKRDFIAQLEALIDEAGSEFQDYKDRLSNLSGSTVDVAEAKREVMADFFGSEFGRSEFWNGLSTQNPTLFRQVLEAFVSFVKKVTGSPSNFPFTDIKTAEKKARQIYLDAARNAQQQRIAASRAGVTATPPPTGPAGGGPTAGGGAGSGPAGGGPAGGGPTAGGPTGPTRSTSTVPPPTGGGPTGPTGPTGPPPPPPSGGSAPASASAAVTFTLPAELSKASPRYRNKTIKWESDYDKAAYVLSKNKRGTNDGKWEKALEDAGLDVDEARNHGIAVRQALADAYNDAVAGKSINVAAQPQAEPATPEPATPEPATPEPAAPEPAVAEGESAPDGSPPSDLTPSTTEALLASDEEFEAHSQAFNVLVSNFGEQDAQRIMAAIDSLTTEERSAIYDYALERAESGLAYDPSWDGAGLLNAINKKVSEVVTDAQLTSFHVPMAQFYGVKAFRHAKEKIVNERDSQAEQESVAEVQEEAQAEDVVEDVVEDTEDVLAEDDKTPELDKEIREMLSELEGFYADESNAELDVAALTGDLTPEGQELTEFEDRKSAIQKSDLDAATKKEMLAELKEEVKEFKADTRESLTEAKASLAEAKRGIKKQLKALTKLGDRVGLNSSPDTIAEQLEAYVDAYEDVVAGLKKAASIDGVAEDDADKTAEQVEQEETFNKLVEDAESINATEAVMDVLEPDRPERVVAEEVLEERSNKRAESQPPAAEIVEEETTTVDEEASPDQIIREELGKDEKYIAPTAMLSDIANILDEEGEEAAREAAKNYSEESKEELIEELIIQANESPPADVIQKSQSVEFITHAAIPQEQSTALQKMAEIGDIVDLPNQSSHTVTAKIEGATPDFMLSVRSEPHKPFMVGGSRNQIVGDIESSTGVNPLSSIGTTGILIIGDTNVDVSKTLGVINEYTDSLDQDYTLIKLKIPEGTTAEDVEYILNEFSKAGFSQGETQSDPDTGTAYNMVRVSEDVLQLQQDVQLDIAQEILLEDAATFDSALENVVEATDKEAVEAAIADSDSERKVQEAEARSTVGKSYNELAEMLPDRELLSESLNDQAVAGKLDPTVLGIGMGRVVETQQEAQEIFAEQKREAEEQLAVLVSKREKEGADLAPDQEASLEDDIGYLRNYISSVDSLVSALEGTKDSPQPKLDADTISASEPKRTVTLVEIDRDELADDAAEPKQNDSGISEAAQNLITAIDKKLNQTRGVGYKAVNKIVGQAVEQKLISADQATKIIRPDGRRLQGETTDYYKRELEQIKAAIGGESKADIFQEMNLQLDPPAFLVSGRFKLTDKNSIENEISRVEGEMNELIPPDTEDKRNKLAEGNNYISALEEIRDLSSNKLSFDDVFDMSEVGEAEQDSTTSDAFTYRRWMSVEDSKGNRWGVIWRSDPKGNNRRYLVGLTPSGNTTALLSMQGSKTFSDEQLAVDALKESAWQAYRAVKGSPVQYSRVGQNMFSRGGKVSRYKRRQLSDSYLQARAATQIKSELGEAVRAGRHARVRSRSTLAKPAVPTGDRTTDAEIASLTDVVDHLREASGLPGEQTLKEMQDTANAEYDRIFAEGGLPAVREFAMNGLNDGFTGSFADRLDYNSGPGTYFIRRLIKDEGVEVLNSGSTQDYADFAMIVWSSRDRLTGYGRAISAARDFLETKAERNRRFLTMSLLEPSHKVRLQIKKADYAGKMKILREDAAKRKKLLDDLAEIGFDVNTIFSEEFLNNDSAVATVVRQIGEFNATPGDMAYEFYRNAILSAPPTQAANAVGFVVGTSWEYLVQRPAEATLNLLTNNKYGGTQFGELMEAYKAFFPAWGKAFANGIMAFRTEAPVIDQSAKIDMKGTALPSKKLRLPSGKVIEIGGRQVRWPQRFLLMGDDFGKTLIVEMEVRAQAYRSWKNNPDASPYNSLAEHIEGKANDVSSAEWQEADKLAKWIAFQSEPGAIAKAIMRWREDESSNLIKHAVRVNAPFVVTPANIVKVGFSKTPLGSFYFLTKEFRQEAGEVGVTSNRVKSTDQDLRRATEQLLSWGIVAALMKLNEDEDENGLPRITGSRGYGAESAMQYRTAPPMSIRIGGHWYNYSRIEPFATTVALTLDSISAMQSSAFNDGPDSAGQSIMKATKAVGGTVMDKTFMRQLGDFMRGVHAATTGQSEQPILKWALNYPASLRWNFFKQYDRAMLDAYAEKRPLTLSESLKEQWKPGSSVAGQKVDVWGNLVSTQQVGEPESDFWLTMLSPVRIQEAKDPIKYDVLIMNYNKTRVDENPYLPEAPRHKFRKKGVEYVMDPLGYQRFMEWRGKKVLEMLEWEDLDFERPAKYDIDIIKSKFSKATTMGREAWMNEEGLTAGFPQDDVTIIDGISSF